MVAIESGLTVTIASYVLVAIKLQLACEEPSLIVP